MRLRNLRDFNLAQNFSAWRGIWNCSSPNSSSWYSLTYYLALVMMVDGVIWYSAGSLSIFSGSDLIIYSIFSYPLWMLMAAKGLQKEQSDLQESGRWFVIGALPFSASLIFLGCYLFKTIRMRAIWVWFLVYFVFGIYRNAPVFMLLQATFLIFSGFISIQAADILLRFLSPKGYSGLAGQIFYSVTWILSGAAFPLDALNMKKELNLYFPFASAVNQPLSLLLIAEPVSSQKMASFVFVSAAWCLLFLICSIIVEKKRREFLHA